MGTHGLNKHTIRGLRNYYSLSPARLHFHSQYMKWCHSNIATTPDIAMGGKAYQYTDTVQIGGLEPTHTVSRRRLGIGNRGTSPRKPLHALKDIGRVFAITPLVEGRVLHRGRVPPSQTRIYTMMQSWYTTLTHNIKSQINDSTLLPSTGLIRLPIEAQRLLQVNTIAQIQQKWEERVLYANDHRNLSRNPSERLGMRVDEIISFERININGINSH